MATAKLFAATGDFKNDIQLPAMFDQEVNKVCMYLHIKAILNNNRQGTAQAKNKSSVSGGGQKPWKQKGTGRARSGQNTSAVWVRGAKAHGPKSHDYFEKVNKKVKKIAFHSALAAKAAEGKVQVFEAKNLYLSSNNIPWCRCARVADVNTYDIVRANNVVISQAALAELEGGR